MADKIAKYVPLNGESKYDGKAIVRQGKNSKDLTKYLNTVQKDPENPSAWEKSGGVLWGDTGFYTSAVNDPTTGALIRSPRSPRGDLEDALSQTQNDNAEFVKAHKSTILGKLAPENYEALTLGVEHLYKTGDKKLDEFVDALNEVRGLGAISQEPQKVREYVSNRLKKEKAPAWAIASFARTGEGDSHRILRGYMTLAQKKLEKIMSKEDGSTNSELLKRVFLEGLKKAEDAFDRETDKEDKGDIWEQDIRPYYLALFDQIYKAEDASKSGESDPVKVERNKRRKERRDKGMPF